MVEQCSPGPYLEMFARETRLGWTSWGNEIAEDLFSANAEAIRPATETPTNETK